MKNNAKKTKKLLPLAVLLAVAALLGILLAVLTPTSWMTGTSSPRGVSTAIPIWMSS